MTRGDHDARVARACARAIRAARLAAGLGQRELARASGVSQASVSEIESGRAPRLSTLVRLARSLPALDARAALGASSAPIRPASRAEWEWAREAVGLSADELTLEVDVDASGSRLWRVGARGVRQRLGDWSDPLVRRAVLAATCLATPAALREAIADGAALFVGRGASFADGPVEHALRFDAGDGSLSHDASVRLGPGDPPPAALAPSGAAPHDDAAVLCVHLPARRLRLTARLPRGSCPSVRALAWLATTGREPDDGTDLLDALHPGAATALAPDADGRVELLLDWPVVGACHALAWRPSAPPRPVMSRPARRRDSAAESLREGREARGLGVRELARRAGLSPSSIGRVEAGHDPRIDTLSRILPHLSRPSPEELLARETFTVDDAWHAQRDRTGLEAELELAEVVVAADGSARARLCTQALRRTRPGKGPARVRHGVTSTRHLRQAHRLDRVEARGDDGTSRVRVVARAPGPLVYELALGAAMDGAPIDAERELVVPRRLALPGQARNAGELGPEAPDEAVWFAASVAARRLRLEVHFPAGLMPRCFVAASLPQAWPPWLALRHLASRLPSPTPSPTPELTIDRRRRVVVLEVERPRPGEQHAIGWLAEGEPRGA